MNLKKTLVGLMLVVILAGLLGLLHRTKATRNGIDEIKNKVAEEIKKDHRDYSEKTGFSETRDEKYLQNSEKANASYNRIIGYVNNNDDVLRKGFAGAYMNDDGNLVVLLSGEEAECRDIITEKLACEGIVFAKGDGNYYHTMNTLDELNEYIAKMQEDVVNNRANSEVLQLMRMYPRAQYKDNLNTIQILLCVEEEILVYARGEKLPASEDLKEQLAKYQESVLFLERLVKYDKDMVRIEIIPDAGYQPGTDLTEAWRPGRSMFVVEYGASIGAACSTGYRVNYTFQGANKYGFITSAHGNDIGYLACVSNSGPLIVLGTVVDRTYVGRLDVAFIEFTNSNYTNGQAIYYTNSIGGTSSGDVLDGTLTVVPAGQLIYKSGASSYLSSGYVESTSASGYFDNVYFFGLIQADRSMAIAGDSGGVTYTTYGTNNAKAAGIVKGVSNSKTVFVKADRIQYLFYAEPY